MPPDFITAQIDAVFSDLKVGAVKIGMLSNAGGDRGGGRGPRRATSRANVVLDPVMVATSGDRLLKPDAVDNLRRLLMPKALVITPNLPEAAALLDPPVAADEAAMRAQGERLLAIGAKAVLIKGGHAGGRRASIFWSSRTASTRLAGPRFDTRNTHGTGCTLSSAIAAGLAKGLTLADAVRAAKSYVTAAIAAADRLAIGSGHGPVHHFHRWW